MTQCNISEDLHLQQHHCENLKYQNICTNYKAQTSLMNQACACEHTHIHTSIDILNQAVSWACVLSFQPLTNYFHCKILHRIETLLVKLGNTVHGCNQHGMVAARFPLGQPGSVIPFSMTFTLLGGHS
jgi:hypothetical protein